jgi:putative SOS response-associated peptidase YedK
VPLSGFYESVYEGPLAGNIIRFSPKAGGLLWAAGIFDFWQNPQSEEKGFFSFAILTREPSSFILDHGHDRTPIFVKSPAHSNWLSNINKNPGEISRDLIAEYYHPELVVEVERPLKPGWEKRL